MPYNVLVVNGARPGAPTRDILGYAGYAVREAPSLEAAEDDVLGDPPYAVIVETLDATMAVHFLERLRRHPDTDHVPVLVLGTHANGCELAEFVGTSCIPEPYSAHSLLTELAHLTRPRDIRGLPVGTR